MTKLSEIVKMQIGTPRPKMIKQKCTICGKEFKGTVKIEICPTCYI